ncbi:MAG: virulence factor [Rhizobiales bacterium]|nr:virulence factor [Hyphomicrobiales bacterium]
MGELVVIFWRDIPSQVIAKAGRRQAKRLLPQRFVEAIDVAAMRAGLMDADAYLAEWRRAAPLACGDDLEAEADASQARLERDYDAARLAALAQAGGRDGA